MSYEGLEQLLRFLFVLGITHVLYSGIAIGLAMSKVHTLAPESAYECYIFILWYFYVARGRTTYILYLLSPFNQILG